MKTTCANKSCGAELKYLRGGRLFLMERRPSGSTSTNSLYCAVSSESDSFETPAQSTTSRLKAAVTMRRYFWLCESCSQKYTIQRWSENGIELAPRAKRVQIAAAALPRDWTLPGLVG